MDPGEVLYESKENIQPLSHGRISSQFGLALHAQSNAELQQELRKKIEQFELQLLSYDGDDELSVWVEYLSWIEQSFPKGGKEGNLKLVLEKCLTKFKDATWYMQDQRLVKLWLKYIDLYSESNPVEMYSMAHAHGVGTRSAIFYQFWAYEYEKCNNFKKADEIYTLGIQNNAQPEEVLMLAHRNFQSAVARMTLYGTALSPKRPEFPERQVMSALQSHGSKNHVRNVRLGGSQPGVSRPLFPSVQGNNARNSNLKIFVDQGDENILKATNQRLHSMPRSQVINKENCQEAGPWTRGQITKRKERPPSAPASKTSTFQVHTDETAESESARHIPFPAGHCTNALRTIKPDYRDFNVCYAMFEEPDPTKRPMYDRQKVYNGGREFSFEELRAIKYFKKEREKADLLRLQSKQNESKMEIDITLPSISYTDNSYKSMSPEQDFQNGQEKCSNKENFERLHVQTNKCVATHDVNKKLVMGSVSNFGGETECINGTELLTNVQLELHRLSLTTGAVAEPGFLHQPETNTAPQSGSLINDRVPLHENALTSNIPDFSKKYDVLDSKRRRHCDENSIMTARSNHTYTEFNQQYATTNEVPGSAFPPLHEQDISQGKRHGGELSSSTISAKQSSAVCTEEQLAVYVTSNDSCSSNEPSHLHSQSITVNTKEAMCVMNELWGSMRVTPKASQEIAAQPTAMLEPHKDAPFTVFTDDDANDFAPIASHPPTSSQPSNPQNIGKSPRPIFYIGEDDDGFQVPENKENVFVQELNMYEDEEIDQVVEIPAVPSPGMTEEELLALEGTDSKENVPPSNHITIEELPRPLAGILQPSKNIPFEPLEDEDENEPAPEACLPQPSQATEFETAQKQIVQYYEETEYSNMTCTTQAFKFPLMSSTPFHSNVTPYTAQVDQSVSLLDQCSNKERNLPNEDADQVRPITRTDTTSKGNLSIIMENSKEFKSGSSSGSSNGRSLFYNTHWSSTRDNMSELRHRQAVQDFNKDATDNTSSVNKQLSGHELIADQIQLSKYSHSVETKEQVSYIDSKQKLKMGYKTQMVGDQGLCQIQEDQYSMSKMYGNAHQDQYNDLFTADIFTSPEKKNLQQHLRNEAGVAKEGCYSEAQSKSLQIHCEQSSNFSQSRAINMETALNLSTQAMGTCTDDWKKVNRSEDTTYEENIKKLGTLSIKDHKSHDEHHLQRPISLNNVSVIQEKSIDPFDIKLINELLNKSDFPNSYNLPNYFKFGSNIPLLKIGSTVSFGNFKYVIEQQLGKGSYAQVLKVTDDKGTSKALKVQKPGWLWEMYITSEIHSKLRSSPQRLAFMEVEKCIVFKNGSALLYEYCKLGTLLSAVNKMKASWQPKDVEVLAVYWAIELLQIIEQLHSCKIIHGDLKPDNFLLRSLPSLENEVPSLQLIDFGRSIDLSLLPPGTTFNIAVKTNSFQCIEMRSGRPWTYQTDLYGIAAIIHCVLFGDYMKVSYTNGRWFVNANFPRYFKKELWESFFTQLLNIECCTKMPDLASLRQSFEYGLRVMDTKKAFLYFTNLVLQR